MLPPRKSPGKNLLIRLLSTLAPALLILLVFCIQPAHAQDDAATSSTTNYLIQFQPNYSEAERAAWIAGQGAELVSWMPQIGVAEVRLRSDTANGLAAAGVDMASIVYIEADTWVTGGRVITDPAYSNPDQSYAQQLLRVAAALDITEGNNDIVIAIVDTGINPNHPEFKDRIAAGYDYVNNDADAMDDHGHGTHIAGIAAAGLNGVGTVGVCPQCKLMPVKVLNARNGGTWSLVAKGILYAVDHGARVINLSLGATVTSATLENAIHYAEEHDVVVVAAAGNMGIEIPFYPAAIPYVIAVSGTDRADGRWPQSNYGSFIDVAAPAVSIYSTYHDLVNSSGYAYMSGTSMSTPFVSGLAGLLLSRQPDLTSAEVAQYITKYAVDRGAAGKDKEYGHGRIDVYATLLAANGGVIPKPKEPPEGGGETVAVKFYLPAIKVSR